MFCLIWQYTYKSVVVKLISLSPVLNAGVIFICLRAVGKKDLSIALSRLDNRYSPNMSSFSLIIL